MLEPTDEDTAISPNPFRATITLVIKSGIEVPAAKNVNPITYICYGYFIITCFEFYLIKITKYYSKSRIMLPREEFQMFDQLR